jgi:membrane-associated phospholipid phosphatase
MRMLHDARPAAFGVRLAIAIAATVGFIAVYVAAVLTERGQQIDQQALEVSEYARPALLALVSVPALAIACVGVLLLGLVSKRPRAGIAGVAIVVLANVLGQALKYEVLVRPELDAPAANTLPSGHMIAFASVAAGLLIAAPPRLRGLLGAASAVLLGVVAWQLLHAGWHRPSDIVASLLLVTAVAALAALLAERPRTPRHGRRGEALLGTLGAVALVLAAGAFIASQVTEATITERLPLLAADLMLIGAALACVALVLRCAVPLRPAGR